MKKIIFVWSLWIMLLSCAICASHAKTIMQAEVIGRALDTPGLGWIGHVGITTAQGFNAADAGLPATMIIETLKEVPVIQFSSIPYFKSRSAYWGSRYGVVSDLQHKHNLLVEANHQSWWCPNYTTSTAYHIGTGNVNTGLPTSCGIWRCDTFVWWSFYSAGYDVSPGRLMLPIVIFNNFPYANGQLREDSILPKWEESVRTLDEVTADELNDMPFEEFEMIADIPVNQETPSHIAAEWRVIEQPTLNDAKKSLFIDRLSLSGNTDTIEKFIKMYDENTSLEVRKKLIQGTMAYYQNNRDTIEKNGNATRLRIFYNKLLDCKLTPEEFGNLIRGYVDLNGAQEVQENAYRINEAMHGIYPKTLLGLQLQLIDKSSELERIYMPVMIQMLKKENKSELDDMFFGIMIKFCHYLKDKDSMPQIMTYANSLNYKYSAMKSINTSGAYEAMAGYSYKAFMDSLKA